MIGSPHWMAPEVIRSIPEAQEQLDDDDPKKGYDHHCDVWSLGMIDSLTSRVRKRKGKPFFYSTIVQLASCEKNRLLLASFLREANVEPHFRDFSVCFASFFLVSIFSHLSIIIKHGVSCFDDELC